MLFATVLGALLAAAAVLLVGQWLRAELDAAAGRAPARAARWGDACPSRRARPGLRR